ncbi:hypothetical protein, partial [Parvimonas sp. M20]|uniref:hypothetical protein n=1 Tax=Parvimonas sp. M20 TaxID=3110693 RepID=UPI002B496A3D
MQNRGRLAQMLAQGEPSTNKQTNKNFVYIQDISPSSVELLQISIPALRYCFNLSHSFQSHFLFI